MPKSSPFGGAGTPLGVTERVQPAEGQQEIFPLNMVKAPAETILNRPTQKAAAALSRAAAALLML